MRSDDGHAPVELALGIGLLLLPAALLVLSFGPWLESRVLAGAAASESARAAVLGLELDAGEAVITEMVANHGLEPAEVKVGWCGATPAQPPVGTCGMARGSVVSVDVLLWTPLIVTPWGEVGGVWVSGSHSEPVDLYRSLD